MPKSYRNSLRLIKLSPAFRLHKPQIQERECGKTTNSQSFPLDIGTAVPLSHIMWRPLGLYKLTLVMRLQSCESPVSSLWDRHWQRHSYNSLFKKSIYLGRTTLVAGIGKKEHSQRTYKKHIIDKRWPRGRHTTVTIHNRQHKRKSNPDLKNNKMPKKHQRSNYAESSWSPHEQRPQPQWVLAFMQV